MPAQARISSIMETNTYAIHVDDGVEDAVLFQHRKIDPDNTMKNAKPPDPCGRAACSVRRQAVGIL